MRADKATTRSSSKTSGNRTLTSHEWSLVAPEKLHDIHKELAGVSHGQVERLARSSQLWGNRAQVAGGRSTGRSPWSGGGWWGESRVHGGCGHLLRVWKSVSGRHGRVRVLRYHHHHHGVVRQDTRRVRRHVRRLGHAVMMRPLGGGVAVLAGGRRTVAAPQAAAGGVFGFAAATGARVSPAAFSAPTRGGFLPAAHSAAGTFSAAAPLALASCRAAASAPWGQKEKVSGTPSAGDLVTEHLIRRLLTFAVLAAGAARRVAVAGELMVRRRLAGEGMCRVRLIGKGVHHGPRGGPGEGQGGQGVLV